MRPDKELAFGVGGRIAYQLCKRVCVDQPSLDRFTEELLCLADSPPHGSVRHALAFLVASIATSRQPNAPPLRILGTYVSNRLGRTKYATKQSLAF